MSRKLKWYVFLGVLALISSVGGVWFAKRILNPRLDIVASSNYDCLCFEDQSAAVLFRDSVQTGNKGVAEALMKHEYPKVHTVPKDTLLTVHARSMGMLKLVSTQTKKPCWLPEEYLQVRK